MKASDPQPRRKEAFTRLDLVALIATLLVLIGLSLPVFARGQVGSRVVECLSDKQELTRGWLAFAADHDNVLPGSVHGGNSMLTTPLPTFTWARGWLTWDIASDNTNFNRLRDPVQCSISPYLKGKTNVYKCPADTYQSPVQQRWGFVRVRSVAMNLLIGPGNPETAPVDFSYYRNITKLSDFTLPSPAQTFLYIDEHPDSINDPAFIPPFSTTQWVDIPASYHDRAAGIAMADGSVQMHRWNSSRTATPVRYTSPIIATVPSDNSDQMWLRTHTPHR